MVRLLVMVRSEPESQSAAPWSADMQHFFHASASGQDKSDESTNPGQPSEG